MTARLAEPVRPAEEPGIELDGDRCQAQRILVVDEHELIQAGLRSVLAAQPWVAACFGASSAEDALQVARRRHPQIVLVSTSLKASSGLALCRDLAVAMPHVKVVLMAATHPVATSLAEAHGAVASLPKQMSASFLVAALHRVAHGARIFQNASRGAAALSAREREVLRHLVAGFSNPETATRMQLSPWTIKQHTSGIYRKLGVRNRAQAVSRAQELGIAEIWPRETPEQVS